MFVVNSQHTINNVLLINERDTTHTLCQLSVVEFKEIYRNFQLIIFQPIKRINRYITLLIGCLLLKIYKFQMQYSLHFKCIKYIPFCNSIAKGLDFLSYSSTTTFIIFVLKKTVLYAYLKLSAISKCYKMHFSYIP